MKRERILKLAGGLLATSLLLTACGGGSDATSSYEATASNSYKGYDSYETAAAESAYYDGDWGTEYETYDSTGSTAETPEVVDTSRKLIKTVNLDVETKEFDALLTGIEDRVGELGGYIESSDINNGSRYYYSDYRSSRSAHLTIRIPQKSLDAFVTEISEGAYVTYKSSSVQDVTLEYVDVESRKAALETEQERLLQLLEQAYSMEDILTIEDRLTNIRYQLESQERQLRSYDNKVDYSTVYLDVDEVIEYTPVEEEEPTTWQRIHDGFLESIETVWTGIVNFVVWFIVKLPFLVIWGLIVFLIVFIIVRANSKSEKAQARRAAKQAKKQAKQMRKQGNAPAAPKAPAATNAPVAPAAPTAPAEKKNEEN